MRGNIQELGVNVYLLRCDSRWGTPRVLCVKHSAGRDLPPLIACDHERASPYVFGALLLDIDELTWLRARC